MSNTLQFKISSALKDIIGRDLITDDYIAVFELVKNSYDAHSTRVDIYFENIYSENGKIIIKDDGKGMSYEDISNKWLFVAYSAKRDGTEDKNYDYRNKIYSNRPFAGAKGIGRFSCDRLGKRLLLETTNIENHKTEVLITEWEKFETNVKQEFVDINVLHETIDKSNYGIEHGTVLEITNLRSQWNRMDFLKLKDSLAKLINPSKGHGEEKFKVFLHVKEEEFNDSNSQEYYEKVNGQISNFIFDTLGLKTTKIHTKISEDGEFIQTELVDGGTSIYKIKEKNHYSLLNNIEYNIYFLNTSAKLTFTRRMGLSSNRFGHIFLYKNGFRVYPYGEPGEDPLKIDARQSGGKNRYLGTRDLIGQIEIFSDSEELKETSSRGDGLKKTKTYSQLEECFWEVLKRLEKYVVEVQQWGISIEDESSFGVKARIPDLIAKLTGGNEILDFETSDNFFEILEASQSRSAETIVKNLNKIALETGNEIVIELAKKASTKLIEIQKARIEAEKQAAEEFIKVQEATEKLKEQISENLFLKSINTSEYQEVISLIHHIGIYAGTIDNNLKGIALRVQNKIQLSNDELNDIIRVISFETKKILNIATFATKANFKLITEKKEVDLNEYIREYIQNIIPTITDKSLKIQLSNLSPQQFTRNVKPIEINIILDNIINISKKNGANELSIKIEENNDSELEVNFTDNGTGIIDENIKRIYDFGFTTTDGSGLGLYHVKEIMKSMGGSIKAQNNIETKGATFTLKFK